LERPEPPVAQVEKSDILALAVKPSPQRRRADLSRPLHDDEAGALQVLRKALGDDLRHDLIRVAHALAALVSERA
jgi:hypothetical protein